MWDTLAYELNNHEMGVQFPAGAGIFTFTTLRMFWSPPSSLSRAPGATASRILPVHLPE